MKSGGQIANSYVTVPADIVLGPPKTAFASAASLKSPRTLDSPGRSAFGNFASDTPRNDYFNRSKLNADKEGQKDFAKQSREGDAWGSRRQHDEHTGQNNHGSGEETESRGPRRNQRQGDWNHDGRRNGRGNGPSWSKDEETFGITKHSKEETDVNIESIRSRAWRDNDRDQSKTQERDWDRNQHAERDPEWMVADEPEQKKEKHTAQDIEAWKAQMKAQSKGSGPQLTKESSHMRKESGNLNAKSKLDTPLTFDKGMDSFFNLWDKPQSTLAEQTEASEEALKAQQAKAQAKASRFTGFFGPSIPSTPIAPLQNAPPAMLDPAKPLPTAEESAMRTYNVLFDENTKDNDDKAGFDRMLSMLRSSAPVTDVGAPQLLPNASQTTNNQPNPEVPHSPTIHSPRFQKKHGLETILGQPRQPEVTRGVINKDTEFLLNLLRKDEGLQQHFPGINQQIPTNQPNVLQRAPEELFVDERRHVERHGTDKLNPTISNPRIPQTRQFEHPQDGHPNNPPFHDLAHGIPHPPGFDQHPPPPGFGGINLMTARGPMPPPGFPNRGSNQGPFPPGLLHHIGNLNLSGHERGPHFMGQAPLGFGPGPPHHPFPPHGFPGGPGPFPGANGPLPSINPGRPPLMDTFGLALGSENGSHNTGNVNVSQHLPGPPPGFPRQD